MIEIIKTRANICEIKVIKFRSWFLDKINYGNKLLARHKKNECTNKLLVCEM